MSEATLGILYDPWRHRRGERRTLLDAYWKAIQFKANPRSVEYMRTLFLKRWPQGDCVSIEKLSDWSTHGTTAKTLVFLYPDAIGLGFFRLEGHVWRHRHPSTVIRVLNGRCRELVWSPRVWSRLGVRRLLERSMALEVMALIIVVVVTPCLAAWDLVRGHR